MHRRVEEASSDDASNAMVSNEPIELRGHMSGGVRALGASVSKVGEGTGACNEGWRNVFCNWRGWTDVSGWQVYCSGRRARPRLSFQDKFEESGQVMMLIGPFPRTGPHSSSVRVRL